MNTTIDLTAIPLWAAVTITVVLFLAAVGAVFLGNRILAGLRSTHALSDEPPAESEPPMVVVAPWSEAGTSDVLAGEVVVWRHQIESAATPTFAGTPLPEHESVWRFRPWGLDDQDRTGAWPIVKGVDAMDLDVQLSEPEPVLPLKARDRFPILNEAEREALSAALGFTAKPKPEQRDPLDLERLSQGDVSTLIASVVGR